MFQNIFSWFTWLFSQMNASDWVDVIAILVSMFVGVVSIVIAILTLRQNSRMIEESTRPYITVYSDLTYFQNAKYYIILKNFGASGATITKFQTDKDLIGLVGERERRPFDHIENTFIAPGQSFKATIYLPNAQNPFDAVNFHIEYKSGRKTYSEDVFLNIDASKDQIMSRASTRDKELKIISYALQDLCEKHM